MNTDETKTLFVSTMFVGQVVVKYDKGDNALSQDGEIVLKLGDRRLMSDGKEYKCIAITLHSVTFDRIKQNEY